ncbi:nitroreductase family protein [Halalkalibacter suaedae]|uniref:Nitroreductase family protein n=1 Tax=Halalkalibacter suaedae TaxID=2822140 RepID=A0A941ANC6_9BACI|nr:nitroreductase family protein [Bacillus suaedae]MBP3950726.1 nitroreductase family protein [Bacillus suaedae]
MAQQTTQERLTIQDLIESRHSVRKFVQETIPKEDIDRIFDLVRLSPSAWNLQPWRFHVVTDTDLKQKLQDAAYGQTQVTSAPAVILVTSDMEDVIRNFPETVHPGLSEEHKQTEIANLSSLFGGMSVEDRGQWGLTQTNIALGFLLVSLEGFGYSSVPMLGFDQEKVKEILGLSEHVKFAAMVPFGRADAEGYPHHRYELDKIVKYH